MLMLAAAVTQKRDVLVQQRGKELKTKLEDAQQVERWRLCRTREQQLECMYMYTCVLYMYVQCMYTCQ